MWRLAISDNNEFTDEFDQICRENAEDKDFYGQKYNQYNPELHIPCFVQDVKTISELRDALAMLDSHLEELQDKGWDLAIPVDDGLIMTVWTGTGPPPPEDSQFDETGYDLDGNHIDDWNE